MVVIENVGDQDQFYVMDDLSFTPVPAPGALGVLLVGGLMMSRRR